jgi:hypothetical protein
MATQRKLPLAFLSNMSVCSNLQLQSGSLLSNGLAVAAQISHAIYAVLHLTRALHCFRSPTVN